MCRPQTFDNSNNNNDNSNSFTYLFHNALVTKNGKLFFYMASV